VQDWVQLEKEKWLPNSRKRHQIGHLDFISAVNRNVGGSNPPRGAKIFCFKQLRSLGRAFGSRPNAWDVKRKSMVWKLLNVKFFWERVQNQEALS
jgi:hypothetical protein